MGPPADVLKCCHDPTGHIVDVVHDRISIRLAITGKVESGKREVERQSIEQWAHLSRRCGGIDGMNQKDRRSLAWATAVQRDLSAPKRRHKGRFGGYGVRERKVVIDHFGAVANSAGSDDRRCLEKLASNDERCSKDVHDVSLPGSTDHQTSGCRMVAGGGDQGLRRYVPADGNDLHPGARWPRACARAYADPMARLHAATLTPTKVELIERWAPTQPWCPPTRLPIELIGAFRFDDPEGQVGMETHLVRSGEVVMQVPLTYRSQPLAGADDALVTKMEHSVLGTRWVYDGLRDPHLVFMLAAVAMTGQGEALSMVEDEGRWFIAPSKVRITGGGWTGGRVSVDRFEVLEGDQSAALFRNDRFELKAFRRPRTGPRPAMGLTATWDGQSEPVVLAEVVEISR